MDCAQWHSWTIRYAHMMWPSRWKPGPWEVFGNGYAGSLDILLKIEWFQCSRDLVFRRLLSSLPPSSPSFLPSFLCTFSLSFFIPGSSVHSHEFFALYFAISEHCGSHYQTLGKKQKPQFSITQSWIFRIYTGILFCLFTYCVFVFI